MPAFMGFGVIAHPCKWTRRLGCRFVFRNPQFRIFLGGLFQEHGLSECENCCRKRLFNNNRLVKETTGFVTNGFVESSSFPKNKRDYRFFAALIGRSGDG
jgi:hypothetical protein